MVSCYNEKEILSALNFRLVAKMSSFMDCGAVFNQRGERFAGTSKYPHNKMLSFALDGITSFSIAPVRLITLIGILAVLFSAIMILYALLSLVAGHVVAGWTSLMISIWLIGGLIIIALGVVGEYVGKTYLEAKARPRYIIEETLD